MKVYLCGGFYGEWKKEVKIGAPLHEYIDPELDYQSCIAEYTMADLASIDQCDVLFVFLTDYPKYGGLAVEVGYAYARGKIIILVTQREDTDGMIAGLSRYICLTIVAGIEKLRRME